MARETSRVEDGSPEASLYHRLESSALFRPSSHGTSESGLLRRRLRSRKARLLTVSGTAITGFPWKQPDVVA